MPANLKKMLQKFIEEHVVLFQLIEKIHNIDKSAKVLMKTLREGNKILICGNGGSAADSQHFAAELIGRFEKERESLPAIALTTDTSILTAVGNDYGYDFVFEKQVKGLGRRGDVLVGISTSGNSPNVIRAVESAKKKEMLIIGMLGKDGGKLRDLVDVPIVVPHNVTARIQEVHIFILHFWAAVIERELFPD
jgi:D-sedoheptulose 7-phosphate isomerase